MNQKLENEDSHPPSGLISKIKKFFRNPFFIKTQSVSEVTDFLKDAVDLNIIDKELKNGLDKNIHENAKNEFILKAKNIDWHHHYQIDPFKESGASLYKWSPIADELKVLDKEIVLNSIKLKWNLVENEFKDLTKNITFN